MTGSCEPTSRSSRVPRAGCSSPLRSRDVADSFRLAMAKHPEYDDRYWRYLTGLAVEGARSAGLHTGDALVSMNGAAIAGSRP